MGTVMTQRMPFKHCYTYGTLLDEGGRPMHKSWGNAIWFDDAAEKMGVDVMRWTYLLHKPEQSLRFGYKTGDETRRQFLIPLWNVYAFFSNYARLDGWMPDGQPLAEKDGMHRRLALRLEEVRKRRRVAPVPAIPAEHEEELRALGYLQ